MKKILSIIFLLVLTLSANNSQVDTEQEKVTDANIGETFSEENLEDWKNDFESRFNVSIGVAKEGRTFFYGSSPVRVSPLDPSYAKELVVAYEKALLDLQASYIFEIFGRMTTERILDFFEDDSTNAREFPKAKLEEEARAGKIGRIFNKALDVIEYKLDNELEKDGVAPEAIKKMSVEQKKIIFKDNFKKKMVKKAFANISGLVPVQTKVITTKTEVGDAVEIGIIAVLSEKTKQFATDIARRRPTLISGKPTNFLMLLPKTKNGFLNEFGLRYMYDEQGHPMLLSYGRWSVVQKTNNPSKYLRKKKSAKEKARMFAEASIGEFMKSNIQSLQSLDTDSISEEVAKNITTFDNQKEPSIKESLNNIGETIDKTLKKIQAKSSFRLRGTSQVKTWEVKDKNGVLHVGSVVTWTYSQLENATNMAKGKFKSKKELKKEKRQAKKVSRKSVIVNDVNDF